MNRRDFLKGLGLAGGAAIILPSTIAGYVSGAVCTPDNPWLQRRMVETGYSKLRIEVVRKLTPLYSEQLGFEQPVDFIVKDQQILVEFDVPPSVAHRYALSESLPSDVWPHISNLYPIQVDIELSPSRRSATVKAELFEPGDGIDLSLVEKVLRRS